MTILSQIVSSKKQELERSKRLLPLLELERIAREQSPTHGFASAIKGEGVRLIAEIKKSSPSKGTICTNFDPVQIARVYAENGAAAISVVTEAEYFHGNIGNLKTIRRTLEHNDLPLLRKDFIFDPYQVYETRACGADALLLIAAILAPDDLHGLLDLSHTLGMNCLVEVHDEKEVEIAVKSEARIIGINNRNLNTFKFDLSVTKRLRPFIPYDRIVVSESGIKGRSDIERLKKVGVDAVLVGEYLLSSSDIVSSMRELL
jgi:indole-3-glycerol phosphate synthase